MCLTGFPPGPKIRKMKTFWYLSYSQLRGTHTLEDEPIVLYGFGRFQS